MESCRYTTLPRMTGFEVIAPKPVPSACSRKRQRTSSRGIVLASSFVASAARRLELLPFAEGQDWLADRAPQPAAAPAQRSTATNAAMERRRLRSIRETIARHKSAGGETPPALTLFSYPIDAAAQAELQTTVLVVLANGVALIAVLVA